GANLVRADHLAIELGGRQALLLHGDTLCTKDTEYQQARNVLRSEAWQSQFTALPHSERHLQAQALRRRSQDDSASKAEQIMDVTESAAATLCEANDVDLIIHGHTHRPHWHKQPNYERVVLGDWHPQGAYVALYDNAKLTLKHWPFRN
ncbi:MAG: UDP-2,3-diacylglucosamine diphosphatase, partial [Granulosicoccaceae bacterium]